MSNGYIGDKSWRKEAAFIGVGASAAGYPVAHMQNDEMARVWRSADATNANTKFKIVFPDLRPISSLPLCNVNISRPNGRVRASFYGDTACTLLVGQTSWRAVWQVAYDQNSPNASWDLGNAWDRITTPLDAANRTKDAPLYLVTPVTCKAVIVEIDDVTNPDGFVQVGICDPASGFFLPLNYDYGAQYGIRSRTNVVTAAGGTDYTQPEYADDLFVGSSSLVKSEDSLGIFYEFLRRTDKHTFFWWSPDIDDTLNEQRRSYLAKNEDIGLLTNATFKRDGVPFSFKRVI